MLCHAHIWPLPWDVSVPSRRRTICGCTRSARSTEEQSTRNNQEFRAPVDGFLQGPSLRLVLLCDYSAVAAGWLLRLLYVRGCGAKKMPDNSRGLSDELFSLCETLNAFVPFFVVGVNDYVQVTLIIEV